MSRSTDKMLIVKVEGLATPLKHVHADTFHGLILFCPPNLCTFTIQPELCKMIPEKSPYSH